MDSEKGCQSIQCDIEMEKDGEMLKGNLSSVSHFGRLNMRETCIANGKTLGTINVLRDLGVCP